MPQLHDDDDLEDDSDEREYPDDDEADWNLDPATDACPCCGEEISEDASQCPHCGKYLSKEDARRHANRTGTNWGSYLSC